jgi:protein tyrosine/serine phosphatase
MSSRRKLLLRRLAVAGLLIFACEQIYRHGREYVRAEQFAVVEPGKIYRGAWQRDWPMRRIIRQRQIKTIVALAHPDDHPFAVNEKALSRELGVRWIHIPIADARKPTDPSVSDLLEQAAAAIADPDNQPVYFHCHHGVNRASMAQMAYRMIYCGWTLDQAEAEIARTFGLKEANHGPDYRHMRSFYAERVLPKRQAQTQAASTADPAQAPLR